MRKLLLSLFKGRIGRFLSRALIKLANRFTDMPDAMVRALCERADDEERRVEAVGVAIWGLRHKFEFGHKTTTVNPIEYCFTDANTRFCVEMIEASSADGLSETSLDILLSLKQALTLGAFADTQGATGEREQLVSKIDAMVLTYMKISTGDTTRLRKRARYELEARASDDPDVRDLVRTSLDTAVSDRLLELGEHWEDVRQPVDVVTTINFQLAAERAGIKLFVCGPSLLALLCDGALYTRERIVNLGIVADLDEFKRLKQWAAASFEYEIVEGDEPDNVLTLRFDIGTIITVWRHEENGGYLVRRDSVHVWSNLYFDVRTFALGNLVFNVPSNWEQYLVESYGHDWRTPKLINIQGFNQGNMSYRAGQKSLEYLTDMAVDRLKKSRRLDVTYAFEDLADFFELDYTDYMPVRDFYVDTPAGRRRQAEQAGRLAADTAYVLCRGAQSPDAAQLSALDSLSARHSQLVAVLCPVDGLKTDVQRTLFMSLKAFDDACPVDTLKCEGQSKMLYNFDLAAADIAALPDALQVPNALAEAPRAGA